MDDWQKLHIIDCQSKLIENTTYSSRLSAKLEEKGVLGASDIDILEGLQNRNDQCKKLYNLLMTKTGAYEILLEVLDDERQSGALKILKDGYQTQKIVNGKQTTLPSRVRKQRSSLGNEEISYTTLQPEELKTYTERYRSRMATVLCDGRFLQNKSLLSEEHTKHCKHLEQELQKTFGIETQAYEVSRLKTILRDSLNIAYNELELKLSNLSKDTDLKVLKHENELAEFIQSCSSTESFQAHYKCEANKITKQFQDNCRDLGVPKDAYIKIFQESLAKLHAKYLNILQQKFQERQPLSKRIVANVLDKYEEEMEKHFKSRSGFSDSQLRDMHKKASSLAIKHCAGIHSAMQVDDLNITLENCFKNYLMKHKITSSQSDATMGIDLGTVNCVVAVFRNGLIETIKDPKGNINSIPSYVAFDENAKVKEIGKAAKNKAFLSPESTIYDAKRLLGMTSGDKVVHADIKLWPFVIEFEEGFPKYKVFKKLIRPEEISSELLKECRKKAEEHLSCKVTKAVITVPAYFNDNQKRATVEAGKLAGLDVLDILPEPTAAGIAYGWNQFCEKPKNVLIFDLGGGTFDVAVMHLIDNKIKMLSCSGDPHLGGNDMDARVLNYCVEAFMKETGIDLIERAIATTCSHENLILAKNSLEKLRIASEKCKRALQETNEHTILEANIADGKHINIVITREKFDELCQDLYTKMINIIENVLKEAKLSKPEIDEIIMVGGNSRDPEIQKRVSEYFDDKVLNISVNPSEAVAYGAAIKAADMNGDRFKNMLAKTIEDVVPMSIGIECILNGKNGCFYAIIEKNSPYPTKQEETFFTSRDNQESGQICVFQGDADMCADNHSIGNFIYEGIPPGEKGAESLRVIMKMNPMGILDLEVVCESTKNSNSFEVGEVPGVKSKKNLKVTRRNGPSIK